MPSRDVSEVHLGGSRDRLLPGPPATPRGENFGEKLEKRPVRATRGMGVGDSLEGRDLGGPRSAPAASRGP